MIKGQTRAEGGVLFSLIKDVLVLLFCAEEEQLLSEKVEKLQHQQS